MVYKGYLAYNGIEIGNNARAKGYASTADCGINWIVGDVCAGLESALSDQPYTHQNIDQAPWYDPDLPDLSSRFYGVYLIEVQGIDDSTRTATMVEGITSGGRIGRSRRAARPIRVRAVLSARGADALEYGKTWLDSVLSGHNCSTGGSGCGVAEADYFVSCPPARATITEFSPWAVAATNLFASPGFDALDSIPSGGVRASDWSLTPGGHSLFVPPPDDTAWGIDLDPETGLSPLVRDGEDLRGSGYGGLYALHEHTRLVETSEPGIYEME